MLAFLRGLEFKEGGFISIPPKMSPFFLVIGHEQYFREQPQDKSKFSGGKKKIPLLSKLNVEVGICFFFDWDTKSWKPEK